MSNKQSLLLHLEQLIERGHKEAEDLEKILATDGPMMDQQELMELMMGRGKDTL